MAHNRGARCYNAVVSNGDAWYDGRTDPNERPRPNGHLSAQRGTRRNMTVRTKAAIVIDQGPCVHDRTFADPRVSVDHCPRHHHRAWRDDHRLGHHRHWMNQLSGQKTSRRCLFLQPLPSTVGTDSNDERHTTARKVLQAFGAPENGTAKQHRACQARRIVQNAGNPPDA
jgi:hypothetical protein